MEEHLGVITRTYRARHQADAAKKMQRDGTPAGHALGGQSWASGGRSCAAQGFVLLGFVLLVAGLVFWPLWAFAVVALVIGLVSGRVGELTVTWVPVPQQSAPQPAAPLAASTPAPRSFESRLADLDRLRASGLLTDEEYATKRASLLSEL